MARHEFIVEGDISPQALGRFGQFGENALAKLREAGSDLVPNHQGLRFGDVILAQDVNKKQLITAAQLRQGFSAEAACFSHAMLYVGELHVLEAQFESGGNGEFSGTRIAPLTRYSGRELLVARYRPAESDREGLLVARYALIRQALGRRAYDWRGALRVGATGRRKSAPDLENAIVCSELVLEAFAIGGQFLVDEYADVRSGRRFYYPADFFANKTFDKLEMTYFRLTEH